MENKVTPEQAEIHKANAVIQKLQAEIGSLSGRLAMAEAERDIYFSYIQSQGNEKPEEVEEKPKTKKKKGE